jgi:transcriptional regulator with XRE-family HTH domain
MDNMAAKQDTTTEGDHLASRLRTEREARGWSIGDLAARSGVSRAMISKVERNEASPTAALLGRLSGAFGLTLSTLLARSETDATGDGRVARAAEQARWTDPETGYVRRAISPPGATPELVQVELPPGARIDYPKSAFTFLRGQCVWVLSGVLEFNEGALAHRLRRGDCLTLGPPNDCSLANPSATTLCVYLVALTR